MQQRLNEEALEQVGLLIDGGFDEGDPSLTTMAFGLIEALKSRKLQPEQFALLHYLKSNAWANRIVEKNEQHSWGWEQDALANQLLELRFALNHQGFDKLPGARKCQVYTNLGNQLNTVGRFVEAIECWDRALEIEPDFAMALANRAMGFVHYAQSLYDPGHRNVLMLIGYDGFQAALAPIAIYESSGLGNLTAEFEQRQRAIAQKVDLESTRKLLENPGQHLGRPGHQQRYQQWCLENRLYINPLNDMGVHPIACQDVMTLPSLTGPIGRKSSYPPAIIGFYNQLKQEYVSARFLAYEAHQSKEAHYSDEGVLLYNTLDYPSYGLSTEKLRLSYRMAYSIFDKIAFALNQYFELGHKDHMVSFRSVWYEPKKIREKVLHSVFEERENWPLRGLFWLAKDFYDEDFKSSTEPDAAQIAIIRNHLEHKYLKVHSDTTCVTSEHYEESDDWAYQISRGEFQVKTFKLLQLSRAALIYLSAAIHREENIRANLRGDKITKHMPLYPWDDEWKA
tara:strand:- start:11895 stop:13424 length:1530 start_codon:yes stop_codon:yes gene_type:complete